MPEQSIGQSVRLSVYLSVSGSVLAVLSLVGIVVQVAPLGATPCQLLLDYDASVAARLCILSLRQCGPFVFVSRCHPSRRRDALLATVCTGCMSVLGGFCLSWRTIVSVTGCASAPLFANIYLWISKFLHYCDCLGFWVPILFQIL